MKEANILDFFGCGQKVLNSFRIKTSPDLFDQPMMTCNWVQIGSTTFKVVHHAVLCPPLDDVQSARFG